MIGYRDLPYGLLNSYTGDSCFFTRAQYDLIRKCDGNTEIMESDLSPNEAEFLNRLKSLYFIRIAEPGESLREDQRYRLYPSDYKDSVQLSVTGSCNCRCRHCFVEAPHAKYRELSLSEIIGILDQLEALGIHKIGLTGGEPLLHPDFFRIVEEMGKRRLVLSTLYTNGLLLSDKVLTFLKDHMQSPDLQISFDGLHTHDWMRGIEGAEERTVSAIKRAVTHRFSTHISMMLFRDNRNDLFENIRFLSSLGVQSIKVSAVENLGEWKRYQDVHGISREEAWEVYLSVIPKILALQPASEITLGGMFRYDPNKGILPGMYEKACRKETAGHYLLCESLKSGLYINSDGRVSPCVTMLESPGSFNRFNVLETPLKEILEDPEFSGIGKRNAEDYLRANRKCRNCGERFACLGRCRAKAALSEHGILGIDEEVCTYFKDGWKKRKEDLLASL